MTKDKNKSRSTTDRAPAEVSATADQVRRLVEKLKARSTEKDNDSSRAKGTGG